MKRLITILLVLTMIFSLCSCGGESGTSQKNEEIELTLENYATYLNVSHTELFTGKDWLLQPSGYKNSISCNSKAECEITVNGASSNYDYNGVVLTLKVSAIYNTFRNYNEKENVEVDKEITVSCDIGGGGTNRVVVFEGSEKIYLIDENSLDLSWEVVSVEGTVTRAK